MLSSGNPKPRDMWANGGEPRQPVGPRYVDWAGSNAVQTQSPKQRPMPVSAGLAAPAPTQQIGLDSECTMKTILVLEPDRAVRDLIHQVVTQQGWRSVLVSDMTAALRQVRLQRPDVVLAAMHLPQSDVTQLLQQIRQDPQLASIAFIFLTQRATRQEVRTSLHLGADDCLAKPLVPRELEQAIYACLNRHERMVQPYEQQVQRNKLVLERLAYWDETTGLPNRRLFSQQAEQVMTHARQAQQSVAMFYLNVDQLHAITVTFGRDLGSALLQW